MAKPGQIGQSPSVSVVLITYNRAGFIRKAIDSVLAQSYSGFELIIIDDGSTDGTGDVVATYRDPRIIYKWVENGERSRARNIGIRLSRGQCIAFLDSDDWYLPNKLATQVAALEAQPEHGLALGGWLIVDEDGRKVQESRPWEETSSQPTLKEWLFSSTMTPITLLVRKEWLEQVGGFDPELFMAEDVELCIRLSLAGCPVVWTKEYVAVVLAHETNSLRDWPRLKQGQTVFLNKLFSNPDFNRNLKMSREEVFAKFFLTQAWRAYDAGLPNQGKEEFLSAVELNPKLKDRNAERIQTSMIDYSHYFLVADPIAFIEQVFQNLPSPLSHLGQYRREVLGKAWMSRAWRVHRDGNFAAARRSVLHAIWYTPGYLKDRGVLSILFQSLVGQRVWRLTWPVLRSATRGK